MKSAIKLSMKDRIHFSNSFISLKLFCERLQGPPLISKLTKKLFITNHMTLKPSIRSSFQKIGSKNSLLGKLLMDYISSIASSTSNISLMFRTVAQVQAATQYRQKLKYHLLKQLLTQKNMRKRSFCQKPECLHVVSNSTIAQLRGIKLIQQDI